MWSYEKKLQYPVNIKNPNPALAKVVISQFGGLNAKKIYSTSKIKSAADRLSVSSSLCG